MEGLFAHEVVESLSHCDCDSVANEWQKCEINQISDKWMAWRLLCESPLNKAVDESRWDTGCERTERCQALDASNGCRAIALFTYSVVRIGRQAIVSTHPSVDLMVAQVVRRSLEHYDERYHRPPRDRRWDPRTQVGPDSDLSRPVGGLSYHQM